MAQWRDLSYKTTQTVINPGGGENRGAPSFNIEDGEYQASQNMDSKDYPAASVRPGRSAYATQCSTMAWSLGVYEDNTREKIHVVDGNTWKYWASTAFVVLTTSLATVVGTSIPVTNLKSELISIPANTTTPYLFLGNIIDTFRIFDGTTSITSVSDTNAPKTHKITYHKGRVYAAKDYTLYFSALNDFEDWTTANDAGSIIIAIGRGIISAVSEYAGKIIVWTKGSMHELYGSGPSDYELVDIETNIGCVSQRSVVKAQGSLFWVGADGFYQYSGGMPVKISQDVKYYFDNLTTGWFPPVAAAMGDYIYLALEIGEFSKDVAYERILLKYDVRLKKWYRESGDFNDFVAMNNKVYGVDREGNIWDMRDSTSLDDAGTPISWSFVTKMFRDNDVSGKQTLSQLDVIVKRAPSSTSFTIGYSTNVENNDSTSFTALNASTVAASSNTQNRNIKVNTNEISNVPWYKLRFEGTGQATIHAIQKKLRSRR